MRRFMVSLCAFIVLAGTAARAAAQDAKPPLITNQAYVEDLARQTSLAVGDPMAVFAYVLDSLPERVTVYPTENHYYFAFDLNGVRYAGNIKLDPHCARRAKWRSPITRTGRPGCPTRRARSRRRAGAGRDGGKSRAARVPNNIQKQKASSSPSTICRRSSRRRPCSDRTSSSSVRSSTNRRCGFFCCSMPS